MDDNIYNVVNLPNGGIITMDKLAYETYQGGCSSNYNNKWKVTIEFEDRYETADKKRNNIIELR